MIITKEDRNAIIDSMNDKSFAKSFLRQRRSNAELELFKDYEKCLEQ